jgi:glutamate-1-semialdehyde 2,1-aminomutase
MEMMASKDPARFLAHTGTFNANPVSATAGITTLELVANEPINERADAMADRLKQGLNDALSRMEVSGHAHGLASVVNLALGVDCDCDRQICTLPHSLLAEAAAPRAMSIKLAMLNEGVDTFGGIGFMVSAVHEEQQIDRTVEAFERALVALRDDGVV